MSRLIPELIAFAFALFFIFICQIIAEITGVERHDVLLFAIVVKIMRPDAWGIFK